MANKQVKGAKQMLYMTERDREDLRALSDLTGQSASEIVRDSLADKFGLYRNSVGRIEPVPAIYKDGRYCEENPCFVLSTEPRYGQNYALIYYENTLQRVPEIFIRYLKRRPVAYKTVFFSCTDADSNSVCGFIGYTDNTNWILINIEEPPFTEYLSVKRGKSDVDHLFRSRIERAINEHQIKDAREIFESEDTPDYRSEFKMMNTEPVMKELGAKAYYIL